MGACSESLWRESGLIACTPHTGNGACAKRLRTATDRSGALANMPCMATGAPSFEYRSSGAMQSGPLWIASSYPASAL